MKATLALIAVLAGVAVAVGWTIGARVERHRWRVASWELLEDLRRRAMPTEAAGVVRLLRRADRAWHVDPDDLEPD